MGAEDPPGPRKLSRPAFHCTFMLIGVVCVVSRTCYTRSAISYSASQLPAVLHPLPRTRAVSRAQGLVSVPPSLSLPFPPRSPPPLLQHRVMPSSNLAPYLRSSDYPKLFSQLARHIVGISCSNFLPLSLL
jgi:hypothetical protein